MSHDLRHVGSLITVGKDHCLGYLFVHEGRAYDAELGAVDVSEDDANTHNKLLDEAIVEGLDRNCTVGLGGTLYLKRPNGTPQVITWCGTVVSDDVTIHGAVLTFRRRGMTFRGRVRSSDDCFNFKRTA